jgi:hypothetical protein
MRTAVAATALGLTLVAAAALAACSPDDPVDLPDPLPSSTPVFASDEEALAAAEELYGEYLAAENQLGAAGWKDTSLVEPFVRGAALEDEVETAEGLSSKGYSQTGLTSFDSLALQQLHDDGPGALLLTVYLCLDFSIADVVDASGASVVDPARADRLALEIDLDDLDGDLKISRSDAWSGESFC